MRWISVKFDHHFASVAVENDILNIRTASEGSAHSLINHLSADESGVEVVIGEGRYSVERKKQWGRCYIRCKTLDSAVLNRLNRIMPRQAGLDVPGALHHIMIRGIDKTNILLVDGYCNGIGPIRGDEKQSHKRISAA
jgi:hypothetical protein